MPLHHSQYVLRPGVIKHSPFVMGLRLHGWHAHMDKVRQYEYIHAKQCESHVDKAEKCCMRYSEKCVLPSQ